MELTQDRYKQFRRIPHVSQDEILMFFEGEKPGVFGNIQEEYEPELQELCSETDAYLHTYVNDLRPDKGPKYRFTLQPTKQDAERVEKSHRHGDWDHMGEALGYPKCCVETFNENRSPDEYIAQKVDSTTPYPFYTNRFVRMNKSRVLLSHFPCSYDCEESVALGKERLQLLEEYRPDKAVDIRDYLQSAVIYKHGHGCAVARDYTQNGDTVVHDGFKNVRRSSEEFMTQVNATSEFTINSPNSVTIGDTTLEGDDVVVVLFEDPN